MKNRKLLSLSMVLCLIISLFLTGCKKDDENTTSETSSNIEQPDSTASGLVIEGTIVELVDTRNDPLEVRQQRLLDNIASNEGLYADVFYDDQTIVAVEIIINLPEQQLVLSYDEAMLHWAESDEGREYVKSAYVNIYGDSAPEILETNVKKIILPNGEFCYLINDILYCYPEKFEVYSPPFYIGPELSIYGVCFRFRTVYNYSDTERLGGFTVLSFGDSPDSRF